MGGRHPGCSRLLGHSRGPKGSGPNGSPRPNRSWPGLGLALPRRVDPPAREVPLPQVAAGDFSSHRRCRRRDTRVSDSRSSWGKSVRRAVVVRASIRRCVAGRPLDRQRSAGFSLPRDELPAGGRFASTYSSGSEVRKRVLAGLHDCRSRWAACGSLAPVNNRQGTAGLASRREPARESMSEAGPGSFQTRVHRWQPPVSDRT